MDSPGSGGRIPAYWGVRVQAHLTSQYADQNWPFQKLFNRLALEIRFFVSYYFVTEIRRNTLDNPLYLKLKTAAGEDSLVVEHTVDERK